ncbi:hypothetical protein [Micromonospora hortensis]|uniref:hypothetical protein n=1 Tax=Micromonospora hortensis TaxID=2911209 RepID=UPI001EE7DEE0|nr:hypothetical protein [Micromonospora hortensis]MCG5450812.1 hypothetical protein [Micromonospora hortensis]
MFAGLVLADGHDLYADGGAILRRRAGETRDPGPEDFAVLAEELRAALDVLPDRDDAGRPYVDLRKYLDDGDPRELAAYIRETVRAVRIAAQRWRPRVERRDRPAPLTATERQRVSRDRRRAAEVESSRAWLVIWREEAEPGERITAPDLYGQAAADVAGWVADYEADPEAWAEDAEDGDYPANPAVPGPRTFYRVADAALGGRRTGTRNVRYYLAPAVAAELYDLADEMHAARERLRAA